MFALTYVAKKILLSNYFNTDFSFFSRNENRAKLSVILNRLGRNLAKCSYCQIVILKNCVGEF